MDPSQDRHYRHAPEVVDQNFPEAVNQNFPEAVPSNHYQYNSNAFQQQQYPPNYILPKSEDGAGTTPHSASPHPEYANKAPLLEKPDRKKGLLCGCGTLVVVLSATIVVLLVAVVGLAVGTGVEANKARMSSASVTTTTVTATTTVASTSTSLASLDYNCSGDPGGVSGTVYSAFSVIKGDQSFTVECNKDALGSPLLKLFTSDIKTCMDACAAFSQDTPASFGSNSNTTCGGISFVPAWTNKTLALQGTAPGNCYLKPVQTGAPTKPDIGTPCHAGILVVN